MIALDTNLLVYAHRRDTPLHQAAFAAIRDLLGSREPVALPAPCIGEFLSVVTGPRMLDPASRPDEAVAQVEEWLRPDSSRVIGEGPGSWAVLRGLVRRSQVAGIRVHDARIAAICLDHGVRELWTADRDFGRFPELRTRNPLVGSM
ncbi:PIN domain-containing protein [Modestobacter sp. I12A-02628]|uniref:Ribonuclease VapC n=1 Tax=Goekera deserti TaxID=2497753 RepID=A0A7K3WGT3_9ACTN|nr:TA system VapC family ribonuclease toxin [Goekera deserti]MPQ97343.1 PIN domain-containing protein [Goekera deserti]NDI50144.1 PIN domain-containing protein [Goekera deserti]NEL55711.1 PIN domain-containing protein [Goekera deserti]